jgi:hypothetical protein
MLKIYDVSLDIIRALVPYVAELKRKSPARADQLERALTTTTLAIAEGARSRGRNRPAHYQRGCASMDECIAVTDVAAAAGQMAPLAPSVRDAMRHVVAVLVKVSR